MNGTCIKYSRALLSFSACLLNKEKGEHLSLSSFRFSLPPNMVDLCPEGNAHSFLAHSSDVGERMNF